MSHQLTNAADCLLVLVDVQERLLPVIDGHAAVLANCQRLARFAGIMGLPVLACRQRNLGAVVEPLAQALPQGAPPAIEKISFDCFGEPAFAQAVVASGRRTLIVCGIEAHICVLQTALGGLVAGHVVQVLADAVGSRAPHNHRVALERLAKAGALISTTEMFIYELLRRADSEQFRQTLPLVK